MGYRGMVEPEPKAVAARIAEARKRLGHTRDIAARKMNVHPSNFSRWETGRQPISGLMLYRLASLSGMTPDYILGKTDDPKGLAAQNGNQPQPEPEPESKPRKCSATHEVYNPEPGSEVILQSSADAENTEDTGLDETDAMSFLAARSEVEKDGGPVIDMAQVRPQGEPIVAPSGTPEAASVAADLLAQQRQASVVVNPCPRCGMPTGAQQHICGAAPMTHEPTEFFYVNEDATQINIEELVQRSQQRMEQVDRPTEPPQGDPVEDLKRRLRDLETEVAAATDNIRRMVRTQILDVGVQMDALRHERDEALAAARKARSDVAGAKALLRDTLGALGDDE